MVWRGGEPSTVEDAIVCEAADRSLGSWSSKFVEFRDSHGGIMSSVALLYCQFYRK